MNLLRHRWEAWGSSRGYSIESIRARELVVRSTDQSVLHTPELVYNRVPSSDLGTCPS